MSINKKQFFEIYIGVYSTYVYISMYQTNEEFKKSLSANGIYLNDCHNFLDMSGKTAETQVFNESVYIIRCVQFVTKYELINTLSHEISHLTGYILNNCDIKYRNGSANEAYAYLTGFLTEEIFKKLKI